MDYTLIRDRKWIAQVIRFRNGHKYYAWPGENGKCWSGREPVAGWTMGGIKDALEEVASAIDKLQGRPQYCELPRKVKGKV